MLLDYLSTNWNVQAIFVAGVVAIILFGMFRRSMDAADIRKLQREREREQIIEAKASTSKSITVIDDRE